MGSLMSLRSDLLRGDLRCLYLGWLLCAQNEEFAEDELEPAVPAGLGETGRTNDFEWSDGLDPASCCCSGRPLRTVPKEHAMPDDVL